LLLVVVGLLAIALGSFVRIQSALDDPAFDRTDPRGLLRSDPALLYYVTERIVAAHGGPPDDWRADSRIEHPRAFDVPANLTVAQEFLVAWVDRLTGERLPLHVLCVVVMGIVASTAAIGVLGLAWELTRSPAWSALAAALFLLTPASYRTIGFVLVNEDLSLPFALAHLWLLARAARVRTGGAYALAGLTLGLALSSWHAASFFVTLEAAVCFACFLASGKTPFAERRSWMLVAVAALFALAVPALRAKLTLLSPPFAIGFALLGASFARGRERRVALAILVALLGVGAWCSRHSRSGLDDFSHVWSVLAAKLAHLGRFPSAPSSLSFEARLLWQGPFETMAPSVALASFQLAGIVGLPAAIYALATARRERSMLAAIALLALACALATWLVARVSVFTAPLFVVLAVYLFARVFRARSEWLARKRASASAAGAAPLESERSLLLLAARALPLLLVLAMAAQASAFASWHSDLRRDGLAWYRPRAHAAGMVAALEAVERHVPPGEAVAADFMLSPAILAHTGRPILIQPKWESRESRARVEELWTAFYQGTPDELQRLLRESYGCVWLLVDQWMLRDLLASRRLAGLADSEPLPSGSAAEAFLAKDADLAPPPGWSCVWTNRPAQGAEEQSTFTLWRISSER
jgi:hypothetical protein